MAIGWARAGALWLVLSAAGAAGAVDRTWVGGAPGGPSDWSRAANWTPAGEPAADDAVFIRAAAQPPELTDDAVCGRLDIADGGRLTLAGHRLDCAGLRCILNNDADAGLWLTHSADDLRVNGDAEFGIQNDSPNATSAGKLTAGTIRFRGGFEANPGYHPDNDLQFVPTGTTVVFDGNAAQWVYLYHHHGFDGSHFHHVVVANPRGVVFDEPYISGRLSFQIGGVARGHKARFNGQLPDEDAGYEIERTVWQGDMALCCPTAWDYPAVEIRDGGRVDLNGQTLIVHGNLTQRSRTPTEGLFMQDPNDRLDVRGRLDLGELGEAGGGVDHSYNHEHLTAGVIKAGGDVYCSQSAYTEAYARALAGTKLVLESAGPQLVSYFRQHGAQALMLGDVELRNPTTVGFAGAFVLRGTLGVPANFNPTIASHTDDREAYSHLYVDGIDLDGATFKRTSITIGDGVFRRFEDVAWDGKGGAFAVEIDRAGGAPITLRNVDFTGAYPPGGLFTEVRWIRATDTAPSDGEPLVVRAISPNAADDSLFAHQLEEGGADIQWQLPGAANHAPGAPTLTAPADGARLGSLPIEFKLAATDADGDTLLYEIRLYRDQTLVETIDGTQSADGWDQSGYAGGATATYALPGGLADGTYTWRAVAHDGTAASPESAERSFTLTAPLELSGATFDLESNLWGGIEATITGRNLDAATGVELLLPGDAASSRSVIAAKATKVEADGTRLRATFDVLDALTQDTGTRLRVLTAGGSQTVAGPRLKRADIHAAWAEPRAEGRLGVWDTYTLTVTNLHDFPETPLVELDLPLEVTEPDPFGAYGLSWQVLDAGYRLIDSGTTTGGREARMFLPPIGPGRTATFRVRVRVAPQSGRGELRRDRSVAIAALIVVSGAAIIYSYIAHQTVSASCETIIISKLQQDLAIEGMVLNDDQARVLFDNLRDHTAFTTKMLKLVAQGAGQNAIKTGVSEYVGLKFPNADAEQLTSDITGYMMSAGQGQLGVDTVLMNLLTSTSAELDWGMIPVQAAVDTFTANGADCLETYQKLRKRYLGRKRPFTYSWDPNAKGGTTGVDGYIPPNEELTYTISFENDPDLATAAAQAVNIDDVLPTGLDLATVEFDTVVVGDRVLSFPAGTRVVHETIDLRPARPLVISVDAGLDVGSRTVQVRLRGLDPGTGQLAADGFLPPNQTSPEGEGLVTFRVRPTAGLASGTAIDNTATILFDAHTGVNQPITTNEHALTVDSAPPTASLGSLQATVDEPYFEVPYSVADAGVGVAYAEIWVSDGGRAYELWRRIEPGGRQVAETALFAGTYNRRYAFRLLAEDRLGNRLPTDGLDTVEVTVGPPPTLPAGLHLLSVPLDTGGADPDAVFDFVDNEFACFCSTDGEYVRFPDQRLKLALGRGYWTRLRAPLTPPIIGRAADPSDPVRIPLRAGWNQIGTPWPHAVPWSLTDIRVTSAAAIPSDCGCEPDDANSLSLAEAARAGWVADYAWAWLPDDTEYGGRYVLIYDQSVLPDVRDQLEPWRGYWFHAQEPATLIIPPPTAPVSRARRAAPGAWSFALTAATDEGAAEVRLGVAVGRALRVGRPPAPPGSRAPLAVAAVADGLPLAVDLRGTPRARQEWTVVVDSPPTRGTPAPVTVRWPNLRAVPADVGLTLIDTQTGRRRALRSTAGYEYTPSAGETRRTFTIVAERGAAPLAVLGLRVLPTRAGVEVTYELTAAADCRLLLRSPAGRAVATLDAGGTRAAGRWRLAADLRDGAGRRLPHGLYQIELIAVDADGRQARAVQPLLVR